MPIPRGSADGKEIVDLNAAAKDAKNFIDKFLGDVSKKSATKQLIWGGASGLCTGFISMRVGKAAATALGGGILLLTIANQKGYISVDWDKLSRSVDKAVDKVEKAAGGAGPSTMDKLERFANRKIDKAEGVLKKKEQKVRRWFTNDRDEFQISELHIFAASYAAGLALGTLLG
ncbi:FUN14 domain-containing protein 1 [Neocloeon triangulifer]|uniref:FUN14 domain-containing protein 1 n=1 Tax=Neocloeon triangulifer TaxID=2078957 RepID=UPI00286EDC10|nr:FUN14 domain-containing protein 1 [Neocloeon triangulifer]